MLRTPIEIPDWLADLVFVGPQKPWTGLFPYEGWDNERIDESGRWIDDGGPEPVNQWVIP